jgi:hypothetical protein
MYDTRTTGKPLLSHYHLDIVPTIYEDNFWQQLHAYQYTYHHNTFPVDAMPALYFNYHIGGASI